MSICTKKNPVPFATLSTLQTEDPDDSDFYNATLTVTAPQKGDLALVIDKISLNLRVFESGVRTPDPTEFVAIKIISRGKTILNRALNASEACALFSENARNVKSENVDVVTWNFFAQGCAVVLANAGDIIEVSTHTKNSTVAPPMSATGCYRSKQDPEVCSNTVPFVAISTQALADGPDETQNSVSTLNVQCSRGTKREIHRIVLSGSNRFRDGGNEPNNYSIDVKSSGLTTFSGVLTAEAVEILAPVTKIDDVTGPDCNFQLWNFSCPVNIKSRSDVVNIVATDNNVDDNSRPIPLVALGCQTLCNAHH